MANLEFAFEVVQCQDISSITNDDVNYFIFRSRYTKKRKKIHNFISASFYSHNNYFNSVIVVRILRWIRALDDMSVHGELNATFDSCLFSLC